MRWGQNTVQLSSESPLKTIGSRCFRACLENLGKLENNLENSRITWLHFFFFSLCASRGTNLSNLEVSWFALFPLFMLLNAYRKDMLYLCDRVALKNTEVLWSSISNLYLTYCWWEGGRQNRRLTATNLLQLNLLPFQHNKIKGWENIVEQLIKLFGQMSQNMHTTHS